MGPEGNGSALGKGGPQVREISWQDLSELRPKSIGEELSHLPWPYSVWSSSIWGPFPQDKRGSQDIHSVHGDLCPMRTLQMAMQPHTAKAKRQFGTYDLAAEQADEARLVRMGDFG